MAALTHHLKVQLEAAQAAGVNLAAGRKPFESEYRASLPKLNAAQDATDVALAALALLT